MVSQPVSYPLPFTWMHAMSGDTLFIFILIGLVAVLKASNPVRFDIVALLVVLALILSGVQTAGEPRMKQ